jgi:uroporphyrinogen III methyltransferase / synthase
VAKAACEAGLKNPGIVIVGEVVRLRASLRWFDTQPLFGRRVLVPRAVEQGVETAKALRERGAAPVLAPLIELHDPPDPEPLRRAVAELGSFDWLVFTSVNSVDRCFAEIARQGRDARAFGASRVAAIGPKTAAALRRHGITSDLVASDFVAEALVADLLTAGPARRVLVPRALVARELLPEALRAAGIEVVVAPAYETRPLRPEAAETLRAHLARGEVDVALFTSSSTVDAFADALGEAAAAALADVTVACIGPITEATARRRGLRVDGVALGDDVDGLLDALERHFAAR